MPRLRVLPPLPPPPPDPASGALAARLAAEPPDRAGARDWAAGLVAASLEDRQPKTPRAAALAAAEFGIAACFISLIAWGVKAPVAPPELAALMDVKNFLERPKRTAMRRRVETAASAPERPGLVPTLARLLSRAAVARDGAEAAALVAEAIGRLAEARGPAAIRTALLRVGR